MVIPPRGVTIFIMKNHKQRINNIIGQLRGINKMLDNDEKNCLDVIIQLKAVNSALQSLEEKFLEEEFNSCLKKVSSKDKKNLTNIFKEIVKK